MRRSIVLSTIVGLGLAASAIAAPTGGRSVVAWASGRVERFDPATSTLVLKQGHHAMTFVVAPDAKVSRGQALVSSTDLTSEAGHRVRVKYVMLGGTRKASLIEVSAATPRSAHQKAQAKS